MIHAIDVEILHELINMTKIQTHKTDIALHQEIDSVMTEALLLHNTLDHDMTSMHETHDLIALLIDLLTDPLIGMTLVIDIDHVHFQEIITILQCSYRPLSRPRDSRYSRLRSHSNTRNKPNTKQSQTQNDLNNFEVHKYHPTETENAVIPTSWFYSLYTPSNQIQRDNPSRLKNHFFR